MKKYCLLLVSGVFCLGRKERKIIQHDEQRLRQKMDKNQRNARIKQLTFEKQQLINYLHFKWPISRNQYVLTNILKEAINRTKARLNSTHIKSQCTDKADMDNLIIQQVKKRYDNQSNASLQLTIIKTNMLYLPMIQQLQNSLSGNILKPLLDETLRKYRLVENTIKTIIETPNRTINSNNAPVFIQHVW